MSNIPFSHVSVLLYECIEALNIRDGYTYVDATAGGGGHSLEIAKRMGPNSRLICFDRDKNAIAAATDRLKDYLDRVTFVNDNFSSLSDVLRDMDIKNLGGVLADLGCSSHQFDEADRGFSYMQDAPLDMRMDTDAPLCAYNVVNEYSERDLKRIIYEYGEERFAPIIAEAIEKRRAISPIKTTVELSDIIKSAIPAAQRQDGPHPAKRTFQAIRIEVNGELEAIKPLIDAASGYLVPSGRIAIISFHSLEDRIVKESFKEASKKPILPSERELNDNPRSRSAKLRVAEKL